MANLNRSRAYLVAAALCGLLAPLGVLAVTETSADAAASRTHDVRMYKREVSIAVEGEYPDDVVTNDVACDAGDIVADGMWRIDAVDDVWDEGVLSAGDPHKVHVLGSYPDAASRRTWHFKVENTNDGRAQLKLFITCIDGRVDFQHGHDHAVQVTGVATKAISQAVPFYYTFGGTACPAGTVPIAPGFKFASGHGELIRSRPRGTTAWEWGFDVPASASLTTYLSCLKRTVSTAGGHTHELPMVGTTEVRHIPSSARREETFSCDGSYKALVHSMDIHDWQHVWFLGMDPRIKARAYSFGRSGGSDDVTIGALCVKSQTGKQIRP